MDVWMETQTGEREASRLFVGGMGSSLAGCGAGWWAVVEEESGENGLPSRPRGLEAVPPELEMRLSPACCLLRSAGCCCVWCDGPGWTGWSIIVGVRGKIFRNDGRQDHTPRTPSPSVPTGRLSLSRILSQWHPARSWSPSLCHRTCGGCLTLHHGCGDAGSIRAWGKDAGVVAFPQNSDAIATAESHQERTRRREPCRRRAEKKPPNLLLSQVCL